MNMLGNLALILIVGLASYMLAVTGKDFLTTHRPNDIGILIGGIGILAFVFFVTWFRTRGKKS